MASSAECSGERLRSCYESRKRGRMRQWKTGRMGSGMGVVSLPIGDGSNRLPWCFTWLVAIGGGFFLHEAILPVSGFLLELKTLDQALQAVLKFPSRCVQSFKVRFGNLIGAAVCMQSGDRLSCRRKGNVQKLEILF